MREHVTPATELLAERQLAAELQVPPRTLTMWRYRKTGPAYIKVGASHVRYRRSDVEAWLASQTVQTAAS